MTDAQLGLIISAIAAFGTLLAGTLRWAVNRITVSNDAGTAALLANTASNATLVAEVRNLSRQIERLDDFVKEEISGVHDGPPKPNRATPGRGLRLARRGSHHDGEE